MPERKIKFGGIYCYVGAVERSVYSEESMEGPGAMKSLAVIRMDNNVVILDMRIIKWSDGSYRFIKLLTKDGIVGLAFWHSDEWLLVQ